ncbi:glutaredoxin family protein [Pseudomonas sp. MYb185]|uniref:glutaredoxin family protein n=1 Tax=Pseudomonas sp. MYb185 TaxID=1848729 RepID=UPI0021155067|nr:glutaredoxin family protein [Pseudomonas sp. MYb185]
MTASLTMTLFGTTACHLCEECLMLTQPLQGNGILVRQVDIVEDPELLERYQLRIPVLRREDTGAELDWPFNLGQLLDWLGDAAGEEG